MRCTCSILSNSWSQAALCRVGRQRSRFRRSWQCISQVSSSLLSAQKPTCRAAAFPHQPPCHVRHILQEGLVLSPCNCR